MQTVLHLLRSDLRRLVKTPSVPLLWLAFPVLLSSIQYAAFGQLGRGGTGLPKGTLLLVDRDRTTASSFVGGALQREPLSDFFQVVPVDSIELADRRLRDNQGSAALLVPAGFQDSLLEGDHAQLVFTPNPREVIRPQMVDAALATFVDLGNRFLGEARSAMDQMRIFTIDDAEPTREQIMQIAGSFYDAGNRFERLGALADLELTLERPEPDPAKKRSVRDRMNFFAYFLPGLLLFSLLTIAQGFEGRYFRSRLAGLGRRVAASPVRRRTVLTAESIGILLGTLISAAIILGFGVLVFEIRLRQPLVILAVILAFGLYCVGVMKTIYSRAKSKRAAEALGSVVVLLSTLLGGGFAPIEIYSDAFQPFAAATPVGCASKVMVDALVHGKGFGDSAPYLLGMLAWAAGLCVIGFMLARRPDARA